MTNDERLDECPELSGEALERHLFGCERCRGRARLAAAWKALGAPAASEATVTDAFLARVLASNGARRRRERARRYLAIAAAVLLFFFFAGTGHRQSAGSASLETDRSAEDAYANLTAPTPLDTALPD